MQQIRGGETQGGTGGEGLTDTLPVHPGTQRPARTAGGLLLTRLFGRLAQRAAALRGEQPVRELLHALPGLMPTGAHFVDGLMHTGHAEPRGVYLRARYTLAGEHGTLEASLVNGELRCTLSGAGDIETLLRREAVTGHQQRQVRHETPYWHRVVREGGHYVACLRDFREVVGSSRPGGRL